MNSTNYLGLISFTSSGLQVANYQEVRGALITQFKQIYGSDIDVSTGTADGIYIETLSLIINNLLQTIKAMYVNLDTRTATGEYLDLLCALTNVVRKPAKNSNVYVTLTGLVPSTAYNGLKLMDKNGTLWTCDNFTTNALGEVTVLTTCDEVGPIKAEVGFIDKTAELLAGVTITMAANANVGSWIESDSALRARRESGLSRGSATVLEGMVSNLLDVSGIDDAVVYNNDTGADTTTKDGTSFPKNTIYVMVRRNPNIDVSNSIIGSIIYEKKTPGIKTTAVGATSISDGNGLSKTYDYPSLVPGLIQTVYWKECVGIHPTLSITVVPTSLYLNGSGKTVTGNAIANAIMNYMNNVRIGENVQLLQLQALTQSADPKYRGNSTYNVSAVTIGGSSAATFVNKETFFNYTTVTITQTLPTDNLVITIN